MASDVNTLLDRVKDQVASGAMKDPELAADVLRALLEGRVVRMPDGNVIIQAQGDDVLKQGIETLDLSGRALRALRREGIETIGNLLAWKSYEIQDFRNLGDLSMREIKAALARLGLYLRD